MEPELKPPEAIVIGGVNMDICGCPSAALLMKDSNPGLVSLRPGGVGRNIAHDLCSLGLGVSLIAAIGGDLYGSSIVESCQSLGMDTSLSPVFPGLRSSCYLYVTDEKGDMCVAINDMSICENITPQLLAPLLPRLNRAKAIVLDANLPPETIAFICENVNTAIYADPVSAVKAPKFLPVLSRLAGIKPNLMEAQAMTGENDPSEAAKALLRSGVKRVFISLGRRGILAMDSNRELLVPSPPAMVVNTTGAGDAATAAIVYSGIKKLDLEQSAKNAVRAGAITCECDSANSPRLRELCL